MRFRGRIRLVTLVVICSGIIVGMAGGCSKKAPSGVRNPNSYQSSVRDLPEVKALLAKAEKGDAEAEYKYGMVFGNENAKELDYKEAVKWWTKAAEQGHAGAQFMLGVLYGRGQGVRQDSKKAIKLFTKAAEQGYVQAQYALGMIYATGQSGIQSDKEAVKWYTMAAERGDAEAQYRLGLIYARDPHTWTSGPDDSENRVEQDCNQAGKWFARAAEQGHAEAQYMLGDMYERGQGVAEDHVQAYKWMILATVQGREFKPVLSGK
jgi:TPR repeat protein